MSTMIHVEISDELAERLRRKSGAPTPEAAVIEALNEYVHLPSAPVCRDAPGLEEYPIDPSIKSQKDFVKSLGTFEAFMTLEELEQMRRART